MKTPRILLFLLSLLLMQSFVACGEIPAVHPPASNVSTPYPPPYSPTPSPAPRGDPTPEWWATAALAPTPVYVVDITQPLYFTRCTPTPSAEDQAAVAALGLPDTIDFNLQRAIYLAQQQDILWQPAQIDVEYDPTILTISETIRLAEGYGIKVTRSFTNFHFISGEAPLSIVPELAEEHGIENLLLTPKIYTPQYYCPTPGGPTPVPITPRPHQTP